jgi:hypothetical protein
LLGNIYLIWRETAGRGTTAAQLPNAPLLRLSLRSFLYNEIGMFGWRENLPDGERRQPPGPDNNNDSFAIYQEKLFFVEKL